MATRGYQSYRGRNHGKLALVIVLVLILLAAVGYLDGAGVYGLR